MALATRLNFSNERYHYLASHILLLEKQYKKVYNLPCQKEKILLPAQVYN